MVEAKFGLEEYRRLQKGLGTTLKRSDVRVVQLILGVTGVPNTLLEETRVLLAACGNSITHLASNLVGNLKADTDSEAHKNATIAGAKTTRHNEKQKLAEARLALRNLSAVEKGSQADLESIVKLFAGNGR